MAAVVKRIPVESEVTPVDAAAGVVADLEERLSAAHTAAEHIGDARAPLAFGASQGDADAVTRLAELTRASAENAQQVSDLTVALSEAKQRLAAAEAAAHAAADQRVLDHARKLAAEFIEQSQLIDDALRMIVDAHRARRQLATEIMQTGCLHQARYSRLECPTAMACALATAGAAQILAPDSPTFSGKVFAIHGLAHADRITLSGLSLEHRGSRTF